MIVLALDSSSKAASCALIRDGELAGESYLNCGLTHSQTLLPLTDSLCRAAGIAAGHITHIAVTAGPGSFTGLRIGMAAAKALAFALGVPCAGVSTLIALAYGLRGCEGVCLAALDARRGQAYHALFRLDAGRVERLSPDTASPAEEAVSRLTEIPSARIYLAGDGAGLCRQAYERAGGDPERLAYTPEHLRLQRASGAAYAALAQDNWLGDAAGLTPGYLRMSQAERERGQRRIKEMEAHG